MLNNEEVNLTDEEIDSMGLFYVPAVNVITEEYWNRFGEEYIETAKKEAQDMAGTIQKNPFMKVISTEKVKELGKEKTDLMLKIKSLFDLSLQLLWLDEYKKKERESWRFTWISRPTESKSGITPDMIEKAREVPITDLVGNVRRVGNKYVCCCPFHEEHTPSFTIFNDNHFYCFGCHINGDSIDYYMKLHKKDFREAVEELEKIA